jgi:hypothetical protein
VTVRIEWHGVSELVEALGKLATAADEAGRLATAEAAHLVEKSAKTTAPLRKGNLRRSIVVDGPHRSGLGWEALIGPTVVYGQAVELGLPARTIYPVNAQALYWPGAAHPVPYVDWPGFEGRHYLEKGLLAALPGIEAIYRQSWARALAA